jgi:hypothetical protein
VLSEQVLGLANAYRSKERDDGKKSRYRSKSLLYEVSSLRVEEMEKRWR